MTFSGIVPIPLTPFTSAGDLDLKALDRVIDFSIATGGTALLTTVNASEWQALSDAERMVIVEVTSVRARGQLPIIAGVTSVSTLLSVELARHAERHGAAAVNAMPPRGIPLSDDDCYEFYRALAGAVSIPVFVQNYYEPLGRPMSKGLIRRMVETIPGVQFVKEETVPEPLKVSLLHAELDDAALTAPIFGGQGGIYLVEEFLRGAVGNMPAAHSADALVQVWRHLESGDIGAARRAHAKLLPLMTLERVWGGGPIYKEVLRRRGVIDSTFRRTGGPDLDDHALAELDWALEYAADLFTV